MTRVVTRLCARATPASAHQRDEFAMRFGGLVRVTKMSCTLRRKVKKIAIKSTAWQIFEVCRLAWSLSFSSFKIFLARISKVTPRMQRYHRFGTQSRKTIGSDRKFVTRAEPRASKRAQRHFVCTAERARCGATSSTFAWLFLLAMM
jgi:hypothetical protein